MILIASETLIYEFAQIVTSLFEFTCKVSTVNLSQLRETPNLQIEPQCQARIATLEWSARGVLFFETIFCLFHH